MKKLLFILVCFFAFSLFTFDLLSQLPIQEWVARIPGPNNDLIGPFFAVDKNGNSYVAGTHVINDSINILCVKYNTLGAQVWYTLYKYPGEGYFAPTGLTLDSSGNAYVISSYGQGFTSPLNSLIVKFNSLNGSPLWAKKYVGQYGWSSFQDIKIDRQENIYCAGWSDTNHLVIRYNTNGDSIWVRKYRTQSYVREVALACTTDDSLNIIFTGHRINSFDTLLVAKYSSGGVLRWESTYGYSVTNVGIKIAADQNGNLYVGGGTTVSGNAVYLTLKYDRNGIQQWTRIYDPPGSGDNTIYGIAMDRINNALFVTGYSVINSIGSAATIKYNTSTGDSAWVKRGFGVPGSSSAWDIEVDSLGNAYITGSSIGVSSSDVSTLKYSPLGVIEWLMTYNGPFNGGDGGRALEINRNNVYVIGYSQSSSVVSDYVVIKYNQLSGIKSINNEVPYSFYLGQNYPNPFNPSTKIKFSLPKKSFVQFRIYDILGRLKELPINEEMNASEYELTIDGSSYSSGVYFYQLTAGAFSETKRMLIIK